MILRVQKFLLYPILLIFYFLPSQRVKIYLRQDLESWSKWKHLPNSFAGFIQLFVEYPEFRSLCYFRLGSLSKLLSWLMRGRTNLFFQCENIDGGLLVQHGFSTIISADKIGRNCRIYHQVTIGFNHDKRPTIGNNVIVCSGAKIIGGVNIGDNVIIGANAVVVKDIPSNSVAVGIPAKVVKKTEDVDATL